MSGGRNNPSRNRGLNGASGGPPASSWSPRGLVLIIDATLVGVGGVFVATTSVLVTIIAAFSALVLAVVILMVAR